MNVADTLRALIRRWYIVVPGLLLAAAVAVGAWVAVKPAYERSATQLLLPGEGVMPEGATNPFLFLGGLSQATDVLVRTLSSGETVEEVVGRYPGTEVEVRRDPTTSGPVVWTTVTAQSDADAAGALEAMLAQAESALARLQTEQNVRARDEITITTLTQDTESTPQQRTRMVLAAGAGAAAVAATLVVASLVDGLARRRGGRGGNRRKMSAHEASDAEPGSASEQDEAPEADLTEPTDPAEPTDAADPADPGGASRPRAASDDQTRAPSAVDV